MIVALWGRDQLAEDSGVEDSGGWGGDHARVQRPLAGRGGRGARRGRGRRRRRSLRPGAETFWGGYSGAFADPEGHAVGGRPQPALDTRRRRLGQPLGSGFSLNSAFRGCGASKSGDRLKPVPT